MSIVCGIECTLSLLDNFRAKPWYSELSSVLMPRWQKKTSCPGGTTQWLLSSSSFYSGSLWTPFGFWSPKSSHRKCLSEEKRRSRLKREPFASITSTASQPKVWVYYQWMGCRDHPRYLIHAVTPALYPLSMNECGEAGEYLDLFRYVSINQWYIFSEREKGEINMRVLFTNEKCFYQWIRY